jgi:hypothetical protein
MAFWRITSLRVINKQGRFLDSLTARRFNWVGVRIGVPRFLPVPVGGRWVLGHDKLSWRYQVRVMAVSFGSRWNSQGGEQKTRHQRVGRQPYWLCLGSRISPGATRFDKLIRFYSHRLWGWLRSSPGCRSQLIKPSVLGFRCNFLVKVKFVSFLFVSVDESISSMFL